VEFEAGLDNTGELIDAVNRLATDRKIQTGRETTGVSIKPISVENTERIVRFAFDYAREHGRKKVTWVEKANIMKHTDGLFKQVAERVAAEYPDIEGEERLVDNMCMQLVQKPELYDVIVLPNLYGDILSDLCAGLVGGLGVAPGANIGKSGAVFEATHGSAPKYKGLNKVNPTALILSGKLMLDYLGETTAAERLEKAVADVIAEGKDVTYDMKADRNDPSAVGTSEMADAIIAKLEG
jgi:isocitrate dehydrogenase (NAD+)